MPVTTSAAPEARQARVHRLANGLTLVGEPAEGFQSAAFSLMVPAGCRHDPKSQLGLANLTCEMTLRGAGDRDSRALVSDLDALGVERGESVGLSHASFWSSTLSENLPAAMAIYADVVRRPHLPEDQFEAGRQVCLQELRGVEDEPSQKLMEELRRRHYGDPCGRAASGTIESVEALTIRDVRQFQNKRYAPDSAILAVAGAFDWDAMVDHVETLFGDWVNNESPAEFTETPGAGDGHVQYDSSQAHIGIAFPSTPYNHADYFQAWGASGVLSSGMSSRLFTEVREKRGLCYTVYASLQTQHDRAAVFCYAGTTAERAQETLDVTYGELVRLAEGVTVEELSRLKARMKSALIMQQESTHARAGVLARDWRHLGRIRSLAEVNELVDAVTADTINDYLRRNPPSDFTIVTLGPQPLSMPKKS
ncbi:M16 family metallopeptidase [Botrimarina mediterranea]|uniref:Peptidase M16 inactive domain protein n=1 Tax=Botrimarina mediterranea TaxID=2528022 RepID=A0A518K3L8_9BACT|nr:pitrilysin family protein [Botrimarina mediterranea]QDV72345.1 Peptidase M16 inactive domain protein [Botrimarina mediterranea]QDV76890.1 Peptidase M16 inactive domain protein [Planctomycetes bacterium K2D]